MDRLKIVRISHEYLAAFLRAELEPAVAVTDVLPGDASLVAVSSDGRTVFLTYRSDEFAEVPEGELIPFLTPTYRMVRPPNPLVEPSRN